MSQPNTRLIQPPRKEAEQSTVEYGKVTLLAFRNHPSSLQTQFLTPKVTLTGSLVFLRPEVNWFLQV